MSEAEAIKEVNRLAEKCSLQAQEINRLRGVALQIINIRDAEIKRLESEIRDLKGQLEAREQHLKDMKLEFRDDW